MSLRSSGFTPYQALETSLRNVAAWLGTSDNAGTLAGTRWADLMLLSGNPLEDIRNTARLASVMANGHWLPRAKIDTQLENARVPNEKDQRCPDTMSAVG